MKYRATTTRHDGEQRQVQYNTRGAAFGYFASMASLRAVRSVLLEKNTAAPEDYPEWEPLAQMSITHEAPAVPQPDNHF